MATSDIRSRLWDFAYDLLEEGDREEIRQAIASDPEIAREYARTMQHVGAIREVAGGGPGETIDWYPDHDYPQVVFPDSDSGGHLPEHESRRWTGKWVFTSLASLLALWLLWTMLSVYLGDDSPVHPDAVARVWNNYAARFPRLLVTGPATLPLGVATSYQVILQQADGPPVTTRVSAQLRNRHDDVVWRSSRVADKGGMVRFDVPPLDQPGFYHLQFDTPEIEPVFPHTLHNRMIPCACWLATHAARGPIWSRRYEMQSEGQILTLERTVDLAQLWPRRERDEMEWRDPAARLAALPVAARIRSGTVEHGLQKDATGATANPPPVARPAASGSRREKKLASQRWLVEQPVFDHERIINRFIVPGVAEDAGEASPATAAELTPAPMTGSAGDARPGWYDYSTVPPLFSAPPHSDPLPLPVEMLRLNVEQLKVDDEHDRPRLRIAVKDPSGSPLPAVVAVAIEHFESSEDAAVDEQEALRKLIASADLGDQLRISDPPLVFDNRGVQLKQLENAIEAWRSQRESQRQLLSLSLVMGSGLGYVLVLCASLLRLLPRLLFWLPAMITFGICFVVGILWMTLTDRPPPQLDSVSLMNYGIRTEKPDDDEIAALASETAIEPPDALTLTVDQANSESLSAAAWWSEYVKHNREQLTEPSSTGSSRSTESGETASSVEIKVESPLLYWLPNLITDAAGEAVITLPELSKLKNVRLVVDAVSERGIGTRTLIPAADDAK